MADRIIIENAAIVTMNEEDDVFFDGSLVIEGNRIVAVGGSEAASGYDRANAKIIDARRHPMACGFSGYKQLFAEGQEFTYDLGDLGRYYRDYVELMDHWDAVLPGKVLRVQYEDVVADLEGQVRRLLDYCGLDFEPACLSYHLTDRAVRTPSSEQVRQPIFTSGLDYWRNYERWLDPLREALGEEVRRRYGIGAVNS